MNKKCVRTGLMLLVLFVFLAVDILPALAATSITVQVDNKTGASVRITLTGERTYNFTAVPGKSTKTIDDGKYTFSYQACGKTVKGKLKVKGATAKLKINACPVATIKFNNTTGASMSITLRGPNTYRFSVVPGISTQKVWKGTYQYTAYGCGGQASTGSVKLNRNMVWTWYCY